MATIDVLLPVKNGIDYLAESLNSICNQTYKDWRLLVLDHGSTDGSKEMAERYHQQDPRVEVYSFPDAEGLAGLLNKGLELCNCQFVMRHDADDIAMPDRMKISVAAFEKNPDVAVISGQAIMIDAKGNETGVLAMPIGRQRLTAASFFRNPIVHPAAIMRFDTIKVLGAKYGIDFLKILPKEQQLSVNALAEDYFLFGQLAVLGKCMNVEDILIKYRWHGGNISILKFKDQMDVSVLISRNLAASYCRLHQLELFDPVPFCNHGGIIFDVDGKLDFSAEFKQIEDLLTSTIGDSEELRRELDFRKILSTRRDLKLAWTFLRFKSRFILETGEWYAVKSWLIRKFPSKAIISVPSV